MLYFQKAGSSRISDMTLTMIKTMTKTKTKTKVLKRLKIYAIFFEKQREQGYQI